MIQSTLGYHHNKTVFSAFLNCVCVFWGRLMYYFANREHQRGDNASQWQPILSDLRSMSHWEEHKSCWCIMEVICQQVRKKESMAKKLSSNRMSKYCMAFFLFALMSALHLTFSFRTQNHTAPCSERKLNIFGWIVWIALCSWIHICCYQMMFDPHGWGRGDLLCIFILTSANKIPSADR